MLVPKRLAIQGVEALGDPGDATEDGGAESPGEGREFRHVFGTDTPARTVDSRKSENATRQDFGLIKWRFPCLSSRAPLRNRTVDLLLTMETLCRLS